MRAFGVAVGLSAVLIVAGCGTSVNGAPAGSSTAPTGLTKEQLFDPCTVPDDLIAATGADPATKDTKPFGVPRSDFVGCRWTADKTDDRWGHYLRLSATTNTLDEFRSNPNFFDFADIQIGGRDALRFHLGSKQPVQQCEIALSTGRGTVSIAASKYVDSKTDTDPCAFAENAAAKVIDAIPL